MKAEEWKRKGEFIEIAGRRVFTIRGGSGENLLCLHGFPTSSFDYHKVWDGLAAGSSLLAFDMLGYGFSDKPADLDYTTADQADLLEAVLEDFGIEETHVISHDYGNTIIQEILARRAERGINFRIASLCFLNGALFPETHRPILAQKILIGPIGPLFGRLIPESAFARSLASVFGKRTRPTRSELKEFVSIFRTNGGKKIAHKLIQYMRERDVHRERWLEALRSIDFPFRFINGLDDPVSGRHLVERFRELIPEQGDIVGLEKIGHFPHFEAPEAFLVHYQAFREKNRQKS
ncbi:MAG: alpha/beta hydrolase [Acidobacteriota bacterium]|nr:MAG: alpha/beta hydrolase [Acidobacteriota bacterium]